MSIIKIKTITFLVIGNTALNLYLTGCETVPFQDNKTSIGPVSESPAPEKESSTKEKTIASPDRRPGEVSTEDPLEDLNRGIFKFNETIDGMFLKPAAQIYDLTVHEKIQEGVHNFLTNLTSPVVFINDLLQGAPERAFETFGRFCVNSTIGLLGVFDPGKEMIADYHFEDFGQTLAVAGVDSGPFLMIPIIGPSNPRDFIGRVVDFFADPFPYIARRHGYRNWNYARYGVEFIDKRTHWFDIEKTIYSSNDPYAMVKTLYIQNREFNISNGIVDRESPKPSDEE